jgi:ABC-type Co2+ transport system permease subunit
VIVYDYSVGSLEHLVPLGLFGIMLFALATAVYVVRDALSQHLRRIERLEHAGITLPGGERLVYEGLAGFHYGGVNLVDGWLTVTDQRLRFEPVTLIGAKVPVEVAVSEIAAVTPRNRFGVLPYGVDLTLRSGTTLAFHGIWGARRRQLVEGLEKVIGPQPAPG